MRAKHQLRNMRTNAWVTVYSCSVLPSRIRCECPKLHQ